MPSSAPCSLEILDLCAQLLELVKRQQEIIEQAAMADTLEVERCALLAEAEKIVGVDVCR